VMGARFWYGLGIIASCSAAAFAVAWITSH
jgi:hypothetical protein